VIAHSQKADTIGLITRHESGGIEPIGEIALLDGELERIADLDIEKVEKSVLSPEEEA
jgi:hypothetical protein